MPEVLETTLQVAQRPVKALHPYAGNARLHSDKQVQKIAASIRHFGFNNPILVDPSDVIVAGHGRLRAAKLLGLTTVPVITLSHLDADKARRAYTIADNRLAEDATWDEEALARELLMLRVEGVDLGLLGFGPKQIDRLLADAQRDLNAGENDADADAPEPPEVPTSRRGDLWMLGDHRLLCGDSTRAEDVERVLGNARPHLMVTDPPYGVDYNPDWRNQAARTSKGMGNRIGAGAIGKVQNDDRADWREAWALFEGDVAYVWHGALHSLVVERSLRANGFETRSQIVWAKDRHVISRGDYHWQHEPCWYAVRKGATGHWCGKRDRTTLWEIAHRKSETGHGTQKPIECMLRPILNNSKRGDAVYEPFSGSGTTIVAAEQSGRLAYAIELDPAYVDVAVRRWEDHSGNRAILAGGELGFAEVARARRAEAAAEVAAA